MYFLKTYHSNVSLKMHFRILPREKNVYTEQGHIDFTPNVTSNTSPTHNNLFPY